MYKVHLNATWNGTATMEKNNTNAREHKFSKNQEAT
jgi:hypothetical protein